MPTNHDTTAAWRYHDGTKHSVARLRAHPHYLDWEIKPLPFKIYPRIAGVALPRELPPSAVPALAAVGGAPSAAAARARPLVPDLKMLARILHFSVGITRKKTYPGGQEYYFRAAACTGALYHIDLYVVCGDLPGLTAGVYHFGPHDFALYPLRAGDHRGVLVEATGGEPSVAHAPVILACASTYWRNAWKYQARAYRHCFWDTGTVLANLLAEAAADTVAARVVTGFVDDTLSALLGLEPQQEGPLALVTLGHREAVVAPAPAVPPISLETLPLSSRQVDYPAINEMQSASSLQTAEEVRAWRDAPAPMAEQPVPGQLTPEIISLRPLPADALPTESIDSVILRRGSTRQFAQVSITFEQLSAILQTATRGIAADYGASPNDLYLIVHAVDGLAPGAYAYHREANGLELLRAGGFRREAGHLGLGQDLPADASVNIYLLCDLKPLLARFGNRGYRVAQLDAAIIGGKLYLAAYALRLGATGLTFFDDDVTEFFSPHAAGKSVMFLVAVGQAPKKSNLR
jgi:SagB-type dehydrogenase family enzyme